ncbi:HAE1 family hydrophobic/amphiphilic exporter-1 [Chitinivorax tropicus]|uniref:HAE1 family hydrophobic/amphiphilic exporter-1 n=1 Tax=Chitinivorax tropicus TaxID=714531 RepID=A0A840MJU7_9PROT|nr:efflux RND transporter permease subunit [Chitinivorax tropicus]MBB5017765.1 HAE1 family hydrophobic/amphiphilic exporter-1 [Chitinivorax tropicus]
MWLTRISVRNPVFATMLMVALAVLGIIAYFQLRIENLPDVSVPTVIVTADYPGAAPEIVESDVVRPLEEAINGISGIKLLRGRAFEGYAFAVVEFQLETDPQWAIQQVREKVDQVRNTLKKEVKEPKVELAQADDMPVVSLSVTSPVRSHRELTQIADRIVSKRLKSLPGAGKVEVIGGVDRQIRILLQPDSMKALGVSVEDVINTIRQENVEFPLGTVTVGTGDKLVQIRGRLKDAPAFGRLIVVNRGGSVVRLEQVATVVDSQKELESIAYVNGRKAVSVDVRKATGANIVELVDRVRKEMDALHAILPPDVKLQVLSDNTEGIKLMLEDVKRTLLEGALLTIIIVLLFLGSWRSTVITGLTLPVSLVGTFFALQLFGFTINQLTMIAMSLCIGLLIDDAIVVRENISRHAAMGKGRIQAALDGTNEIGMAVVGTTLTIVAVFLPVAFMGGIIGKFFFQFGVAVSAAVLISMLVSFTLDPMLSSVWADPHSHGKAMRGPVGWLLSWFDRKMDALAETYASMIRWALRKRKTTLALAMASFVAAFVILGKVGGEFVPDSDFDFVQMQIETPIGSSLDYTGAKAKQASDAIMTFPEVKQAYVAVAQDSAKNQANLFINLTSRKERKRDHKEMRRLFRERLQQIGGIKVSGGDSNMPIILSIQGGDLDELKRLSEQVMAMLKAIPGAVDVKSSMEEKKPALLVDINRDQAQDLGLNAAQIGTVLRPLLAGQAISTWLGPDGENHDVNVKIPDHLRASLDDLGRLPIASRGNPEQPWMIELGQVAKLREGTSQSQIKRSNQSREVTIVAGVEGRPLGDVVTEMNKGIDKIKWPVGYKIETRGGAQDMQESAHHAGKAMLMAIMFIYAILATQFRSFLQPLAIMSSLPLALIGVALGLFLTNSTLNVMSMIGIIMLMGLVTKNAILLIDFTKQSMEEGMNRAEAIVEAGRIRLRPILMTTAAMVLGMMPVATSKDMGEGYASMANAVIGGVITSTLLTLVVVPVVFTYLDSLGTWVKRKLVSPEEIQSAGEEVCSK